MVASASRISPADRLDLVIHAAAQLPESVSASIYGDGPLRGLLQRIVNAYGIENRVQVGRKVPAESAGIAVYPSLHNAATAPLRPDEASGGWLILDPKRRGSLGEDLRVGAHETDRSHLTEIGSMAELLESISPRHHSPAPVLGDARVLAGHRIGIITNYPTHYRVRLFNLLAERVSGRGTAMRVFFTDADPRARTWMQPEPLAFDHEFMRAARVRPAATDLPLALEADLRRYRPTVLVAAGFSPLTSMRVARFSAKAGIAWGVWSGEIETLATARSTLRRIQRRRLLRRADFGVTYGYESGEYLRGLAPTLPLVYGRNTAPFPPSAARGERDVVEVLAVSRAVRRKGLEVLIDAVRLLDLPCRLTVAGDGPELPTLRRRAAGDDRIRLLGAVNSDRVGELYRDAHVFAFPTRVDPFGLVIVEAFAAGLAVVTSPAPGAIGDLAVPGRNCLLVTEHDPVAWADALRRVIEDRELRHRLGDAAAATVRSRWTLEHAAGAMICALALGVSGDPRTPGGEASE
jgi:glycosyltransferase involved in cell wall biosynthesis